ncbi:MAG: lipopolysaccharide biosynthesis protein [Pirellulales bacterium]|nr:lipopolysaccharide biosynthesis protein [Pirellulales bacterium]
MSPLRARILRGVGATALGQVANAVIQLVSLPVFLAVWGVDAYGEWLVLSSLAAFLSMSDVGFATAAGNEMTMRVGRGDREGAIVVYHSMWALLTGLGLAVLAVVLAVLWLTPAAEWLALKTITPGYAAAVLSVLAVYILVGLQLGVVNAGFRCDGNFARGQLLATIQRLAEFVAQIAAAVGTGSMLAVATAGLAVRCVSILQWLAILARTSPWLPPGVNRANAATIRPLVVPALSFMGMPLGHALGNQGMIQVVATTLGPGTVVVFSAHRTICNVVVQLMNTINRGVWPEFSLAYGAGDLELTRRLHRQACQWSLWLSSAACVAVASASPMIFHVWTHGRVELAQELLAVLLGTVIVRSFWWTSSIVPIAVNRHKAMAAIYVGSAIMACVVAYLLSWSFGVVGAATGLFVIDVVMGLYVVRSSLLIVEDEFIEFLSSTIRPPLAAKFVRATVSR